MTNIDSFNEYQVDVLKEIGNIGSGNAATSLSIMLRGRISIDVPDVRIIDVDGILDFTHPAESNKDSDPLKPSAGKAWFGYSYKEKPELWMEASPFNYVTEKTPPILFINSSQDRFHAGRDYMIEKMNIYNIYSEVHTIPDTPHPFWLFHPWFKKTLDYTVTFLNRVFKKQK